MIPNDLHYHFPVAVYLLLIGLVMFGIFWKLYSYRKKVLDVFARPNILKEVLIPRSRYNFWIKVVALCFAWIFATLALMQPKGNGHYPLEHAQDTVAKPAEEEKEAIVKRKAHDVIFLLDVSASMNVPDTRTKLTRLEYAKEIVDEMISRLRGETIALYAFTSDSTKLSPLTMDYLHVRLMLRQMRINEGDIAGTNLVEAIADMRDFHFAEITPKLKSLVVLTDGGDTALEGLTGEQRERQIQAILNLVADAEQHELRVFTIGMGTEQGRQVEGLTYDGKPVVSSLDEEFLERLSHIGDGHYYFSNDWTAMDLANDFVAKIGEEVPGLEEYKVKRRAGVTKGEEDLLYDEFFQYPLVLAMLFLAIALFLPDTRMRILIMMFVLQFASVHAQEEVLLTRQAEAFFHAGEYTKAQELFEKLEQEKLAPWQRARLVYNIGTILLREGRWDEALTAYSDIPFTPHTAPLLSRVVKTNAAILQYRRATSLEKQTLSDYSQALYLYREVLRNINEADDAECILQSVLGKEICRSMEDLKALRSAVKNDLAIATKKFGETKIAESPIKDGIPYLLSGIKLVLSHINFLESKTLNEKLKREYLKLYARDAESWLLLWNSQVEKMAELEEAYTQYFDGLILLQRNELDESRLAFLGAEATLVKLMATLWGTDPLFELIQKLLASYQRALDQVPVQTPALYRLQVEQGQVADVVMTGGISVQELNLSNEFLEKSLEYAREAKSAHARFFLEEARQWVRRLLRQQVLTPKEILEDAIEEQMHALTLHRLSREMVDEEANAVLLSSQERTLQTAAPFLREVIAKEIRDYPMQCQCQPWETVVPLFDKGERSAEQALEILNKNAHTLLAMSLQEEAVNYWKEALERMEKPRKEPPHPPTDGPSTPDILRTLQQMDLEDRIQKPQKIAPQEGIRPW